MKKLLYFTLIIGGLFVSPSSNAQVSVNINIGSQPMWGPVGYDYVRYYYLPEIDVYYNVASRKYTYYHGNRWVTKSHLPSRYRNFDMYRTYKVVINDHSPWHHHGKHKKHYSHYRHNHHHHQVVLRDSHRGRHRHIEEYRGSHRDNKYYKKMEKQHRKHKHHRDDD